MSKWLKKITIYILLVSVLGVFMLKKITHPTITWDGLAYMACVLQLDGETGAKNIHSKVYSEVKDKVPGYRYEQLSIGSYMSPHSYRTEMLNNPKAFNEQIPFYSVKVLYNLFSYSLFKNGVSLSFSTIIPSIISFFILCILYFHCVKKLIKDVWVAFGISICVFLLPTFIDIAIISNPDSFASLLLFLCFYLYLSKKPFLFIFISMILATLARPDNAIFCLVLLGSGIVSNPKSTKSLILHTISIILVVTLVFVLKQVYGNPGWTIWFHHSFINHLSNPITESVPSIGFIQYLKILINGIISTSLRLNFFIIILLIGGYINYKKSNFKFHFKIKNYSTNTVMLLSIICAIVIRFMLYPELPERMFLPYFLMISVLIFRNYKSNITPADIRQT